MGTNGYNIGEAHDSIKVGRTGNMEFKALPAGVDDFGKLIQKDYYYVDKTLFVKELLDNRGEVNLFTRPGRFGKTLNLSMLKYFFENTMEKEQNQRNQELFNDLKIMEKCEEAVLKMMEKKYAAELRSEGY